MSVFDLLTLILGVSLFLFGMNLMSETLKKSAGGRLKSILGKITSNRIKGIAFGALVTAIIQSSSAATVMIVGFVNSGVMSLSQAVSVIMGANIGTSVTSWITALSSLDESRATSAILQWFKPSSFTPILALAGLLFYLRSKKDQRKNTGLILLGFAVLISGLNIMSDAASSLKSNEAFRGILLWFENPVLGLLAGLILTAIIQSSSASIGILQSFAVTGAITLGSAVPIIMGQNIGTCATTLISSAGASKNAKRASIIHLLFNVFGTIICLSVFYILKPILTSSISGKNIDSWGIAIVHTLFNIITVVVLFPFSRLIEKLSVIIIKEGKTKEKHDPLDERFLVTPAVAIEKSNEQVISMYREAYEGLALSCELIESFNIQRAKVVKAKEMLVDEYEDKLGSYLLKVSNEIILERENREITKMLRMIGDIERISDHAVNISESALEMNQKGASFSEYALKELKTMIAAVNEIVELSFECIKTNDIEKATFVEPLEQTIDELCDAVKTRHIRRLQKNLCTTEQGFILTDILTDLERVADHCSNIAGYIIEMSRHNSMEMHRYLREYRKESEDFSQKQLYFSQKYKLTPER